MLHLAPADMPLSSLLPNTRFFEARSTHVGDTFGAWVTTPPGYDPSGSERYPAIFMPDGNLFAPMSIPLVGPLSTSDLIFPIRPYLQVVVGYVGDQAHELLAVRARDLLPPGEPCPAGMVEGMEAVAAAGGALSGMYGRYAQNLRAPRADAFLKFLTEELHPAIAREWRLDPATTGFWGDSFGGLFALWAALQGPPQFPVIGAGSPGMMTSQSKVFDLLEAEVESGADHSGRRLHLSICEAEISQPTFYQQIAEPYARFLRLHGQRPLKGLRLTCHTVPFESHITGGMSNFTSFLRVCYANVAAA